jgi:hypothetical protein
MISTEIVSRPAIAYFPRYDAVYAGLLDGQVSIRALPSELRDVCWALSPEDHVRFEQVASREEASLLSGIRLGRESQHREADDHFRRSERMWTDNATVHEALLRTALELNVGIDVLQQRLFAAARSTVSLGLAKATVAAFGPSGAGDIKTATNALKLLCGNIPSNHPSRSAVLSLALDAHRVGEDLQSLARPLRDQFQIALDSPVTAPDELVRLSDAAYVAQTIGGEFADHYCNELGEMLEHRYTGLWSHQLDVVYWKPEGVALADASLSNRSRGWWPTFRR